MIYFTEEEKELFSTIKNYALTISATPRVVGGFVRDKILNIQSHDIDIALDNISGYHFASGLSQFINSEHKAHKIMANPDKSKHLETAVLNIFGFTIDFVNLRNEKYSDTRIPIIKPGTPKEDAFRRDITINSLFYNLITDEIEDFTGLGLNHLENKIIDTPLNPITTLKDDPLRILRIIRFMCKFNYKISERIYLALNDKTIKDYLSSKVSNERIGIEILKMLEYKSGYKGLHEIYKINYADAIFKINLFLKNCKNYLEINFDQNLNCLNFFEKYIEKKLFIDKKHCDNISDIDKIVRLYILLYKNIGYKVIEGKKSEFLNVLILKENLKFSKNYFSIVEKIESTIFYILEKKIENIRIEEILIVGNYLWKEVLLLLGVITGLDIYLNIIIDIYDKKLENCYLEKPIVNGDFLISRNIDKMDFKKILFESFIIQIRNPKLSADKIFEIYKKEQQK